MPVPSYLERMPAVEHLMAERGLGLLVVEWDTLAAVEAEQGAVVDSEIRRRMGTILEAAHGREFRRDDLMVGDPRGPRFALILDRKRSHEMPTALDIQSLRSRLATGLFAALSRAGAPYLQRAGLRVGHSHAVHSPLLRTEHVVARAIDDALASADHASETDRLRVLARLHEILLRDGVVTAYQPILRMDNRKLIGFEALSRGPRGSGLEPADVIFEAAARHGLLSELDCLCRRRAVLSSERLPRTLKLFVNTLPWTLRDPLFHGEKLTALLHEGDITPDRIVIEITEHLVISNYAVFREVLDYFTERGFSFAVDDVGTGYSGLETIAKMRPNYLKIDTTLVRDVHASPINGPMVKALTELGHAIGAQIIAEGITSEEEARALLDMGVDFGQGFLFGRPDPGQDVAVGFAL